MTRKRLRKKERLHDDKMTSKLLRKKGRIQDDNAGPPKCASLPYLP